MRSITLPFDYLCDFPETHTNTICVFNIMTVNVSILTWHKVFTPMPDSQSLCHDGFQLETFHQICQVYKSH